MESGAASKQFGSLENRVRARISKQTATSATPKIWYNLCASTEGGNKNQVHSYGCTVRYKDYVKGSDWWIADEMTVSGTSDDQAIFNPDRLTGLELKLAMPSGNQLSKWNPNSGQTVGECQTTTATVTSPKTNASYSLDTTVCPNKINPVLENSNRTFGVKWTGQQKSAGDYMGAVATELWHSPPNAANPRGTLHIRQWWRG